MSDRTPTPRRKSPRWFLVRLGVAALLGVVWLVHRFDSPPVDLGLLDRMRVGMSKAEVGALLGGPASARRDQWVYSRALSWPLVYVEFDSRDRVAGWRYDF